MRRSLVILALAAPLALLGCGPQTGEKADAPQAQVVQPIDLQIEIGRYGVMLSQVQNLTAELPTPVDPDPEAPTSLARDLRETVWEYNLARSRLCSRGLYPEVSCGPAFEPTWIADLASAEPPLAELQNRANSVSEQVMPFWEAVCADIRQRTVEDERAYVCAIE
jgi:hypothetical protein